MCTCGCSNFANRELVGELIKDNYVYENLPLLRNLNLRGNQLGYGVAPIPNDIAKLTNLNYLCAPGLLFSACIATQN